MKLTSVSNACKSTRIFMILHVGEKTFKEIAKSGVDLINISGS